MVVIMGARHRIVDIDKTLKAIADLSAELEVEIQMLDANMVFGKEHLVVAVEKAERAFSQKRNISKTMGTEILLYAGAERQISKAIEKMGLKPGIEELAVIIISQHDHPDPDKIMAELGWQRDDSVLDPDEEEKIDMILEKMALSELDR